MFLVVNSIHLCNSTVPTLNLASKCKTQIEVDQIHANLITTGHVKQPSMTSNIIINLAFSKHKPCKDFARQLFSQYSYRDPFVWNAMIRSFLHDSDYEGALQVFVLMLVRGVLVDEYSFSFALKACSRLTSLDLGMQIHGLLFKLGFGVDMFLQNCLICMYLKCGNTEPGRQVFHRMPVKDCVSYNLMIDGYIKCGMTTLARELFDATPVQMKNVVSWNTMINGYMDLENGFECAKEFFDRMPQRDLVSWNLMIDCCAKNGKMKLARILFDKMPERDVVSWATMVCGYAKVGNVKAARCFFDAMPHRDVICCNAMMAGYVANGFYSEALKVFHDMLSGNNFNLAPDNVTLLTALSAAAQLGCIDEGISIHHYIEKHRFVTNGKLGVALINMYAKCGNIEQATQVFDRIQEKSIDHWNAMIGGLAIHGLGDVAFQLFMKMERLSLVPDDITFIAILHACGHSGMVKEGLLCFEIMRRVHQIVPKLQHYGCVVDILSRAGYIEEASNFVKEMPIEPNSVVWRTLLGACTNREELNLGEPIAKHLIGIDSQDSSSYILLSNMYAQYGQWDYVRKVRTMMKERDINKIPGRSWIELDGTVHEFFVGNASSYEEKETYSRSELALKLSYF